MFRPEKAERKLISFCVRVCTAYTGRVAFAMSEHELKCECMYKIQIFCEWHTKFAILRIKL